MGLVICLTSTNELTCTTQNWFSVLYSQASGVRALKEQCARLCHRLLLKPCTSMRAPSLSWLFLVEMWLDRGAEMRHFKLYVCRSCGKTLPMTVPTPTAPDHGRSFWIRSMPRHLPDLSRYVSCWGSTVRQLALFASHREGPWFESTRSIGAIPMGTLASFQGSKIGIG